MMLRSGSVSDSLSGFCFIAAVASCLAPKTLPGQVFTDCPLSAAKTQEEMRRIVLSLEEVTCFSDYSEREEDLGQLLDSKAIRYLETSGIRITDRGLRIIGGLTTLEDLRIPWLATATPDLRPLSGLTRLRGLELRFRTTHQGG